MTACNMVVLATAGSEELKDGVISGWHISNGVLAALGSLSRPWLCASSR